MRILVTISFLCTLVLESFAYINDYTLYHAKIDSKHDIYMRYHTRSHIVRYIVTESKPDVDTDVIFNLLKIESSDSLMSKFGGYVESMSFDSIKIDSFIIINGEYLHYKQRKIDIQKTSTVCETRKYDYYKSETIEFLLNSKCFSQMQDKHLKFNKSGYLDYLEITCLNQPIYSYRITIYGGENYTKLNFDYDKFIHEKIKSIEYMKTESYASF